jgi:hypothetical protein
MINTTARLKSTNETQSVRKNSYFLFFYEVPFWARSFR